MPMKTLLILPMLGMIFLTFGVMAWLLKLRYKAVLEDGLDPRYFKLNKGAKLPDYLLKVTQHFHNLLEVPIFFYLGIILIVVLQVETLFFILISWAYLISRIIHTYIHTTTNRLIWRKNSFIISTLILVTLWIGITVEVLTL